MVRAEAMVAQKIPLNPALGFGLLGCAYGVANLIRGKSRVPMQEVVSDVFAPTRSISTQSLRDNGV